MPLDVPRFVRRFLDHWQPDLALFVESDLWPNLIIEASRARRAADPGQRPAVGALVPALAAAAGTIAALLRRFDLCLARTPADAERFRELGAPRIVTTGNLKLDVPEPPGRRAHKLDALQRRDRRRAR